MKIPAQRLISILEKWACGRNSFLLWVENSTSWCFDFKYGWSSVRALFNACPLRFLSLHMRLTSSTLF